ncbi:pyridoxamine 5'-phosphate oxidase family protein [Actinomadura sp. NBRC 104412]|uniref:pyridoxamine 5'-phosphate oxidase family protein n=1 Tax=Actinomadura sp. NBRC 104412 TaxID=3032203 RepID=UPI002557050B|nr:pyridoxamine 5'-phosphate oxidase family protein [Actinomadura sp. NBRC 104412]
MELDDGGLEILDFETCRVLLAKTPLGRIVFTDRALPAVQPVNYIVADGDVIIRTSPTSRLAHATRDTVVAFEIDDFDATSHTGWSVVVIGKARAVTDPAELTALRALPLRPWAPCERRHYIRIRPQLITGRRTPTRTPIQAGR